MKNERADAAQPAWRPIESAPFGERGKPETYILISKQEQGTTLVATGYRNQHGAYEWFGGGMRGITHWMPLPSAPSEQGEG